MSELSTPAPFISAPRMNRKALVEWTKRTAIRLIAFYGIVINLILAVWIVIGERYTIVSLLVAYLHIMIMPSLALLPVLLLMRRWRLSLLMVAPFLTFMVNYGPSFLPRSVSVPASAVQIHLLTYNMHSEQKILQPIVDTIRDANADIVALQEMSNEMAPALDSGLADLYPYRDLYPVPDGMPYHGRGVLSKYPILENRIWPVTYPIPVRLQRVVIDVNGTHVTLYNFHAPPSFPIYGRGFNVRPRVQQVQDVLAMIAQDSGPILMMCDCNTYDLDQNYRSITVVLHDTYREVGWGMGFTNPDWAYEQAREGPAFIPPHQRPDYIFHNDFFLPVNARVWPDSGGSDHRPVYATLALKSS